MSPIGRSAFSRGSFGDPIVESKSEEVVQQLLASLTKEQQFIVNLTGQAFFSNALRWPTFQYVEAMMDRERMDARSVLATFPVAGTTMHYSAFRCTPWTASLNDNSEIEMTLLGLHHYDGVFKANTEALVRDGLRLIRVFIEARREFVPPATQVKHLQLTSDEVLARLRPETPHELPTAAVLGGLVQTEPPLSACLGGSSIADGKWSWIVSRGGLLDFDGVGTDFQEYVRRLVTKYHTVHRVEQPVVVSPLTLPAAL